MRIQLLAAGTVFSLALAAFAAPEDPLLPIYVDPVNGSDDNNGYTWDTAMKTIAAANAKTETWDYYYYRRCQIILKKGTYVIDGNLTLKPRTSIMGDPAYDRSETILTSSEGVVHDNYYLVFGNVNADFVSAIANLTISNVVMKGAAPVYCGTGHGTRTCKVLTNVVMTCCRQTNGSAISSAGVYSDGSFLATGCEFAYLTNTTAYGSVAICRNGGIFRDCQIHDCYNSGDGQIRIYIGGDNRLYADRCEVVDCVFRNNKAGGYGGCTAHVPRIVGCTFEGNVAGTASACYIPEDTTYGFYTSNTAFVADCTFRGNRTLVTDSTGSTVAFAVNGCVSNCVFEGNSSAGHCVSIFNATEVLDCTFVTNVAQRVGASFGQCYFKNAKDYTNACPVVRGCTFTGNDSSTSGGKGSALYFLAPGVVENCTFASNHSGSSGGAVYSETTDSQMSIRGSAFVGNRSGAGGGAIVGVARISDCAFVSNVAATAGGAYASGDTLDIVVSNCVFSGNGAASNGGALYFTQYRKLNDTRVVDCVFTNNSAGGTGNYMGGAGIYAWVEDGTAPTALTVRNCLFVGNVLTNTTTTGYGSAVILMSRSKTTRSPIFLESCTIVGNRSMCGSRAAVYVWPDNAQYGMGFTYITNTLIACNLDADGAYVPRSYESVYEITSDMRKKVGYSVFHPQLKLRETVITFDESQHVTSTDTLPAFKPGTWIPKRSNPAFNAGLNLPWMTAAYDLQRDEKGEPFVPRICRDTVDIGAYENMPSGLGMLLLFR